MLGPMSKKKISTSIPQQLLQSPFLTLSSEGLPKGPADPLPPAKLSKARLVLRREKSQRGGKTVIVVSQLPTHLSSMDIERILRAARKTLGCGGCMRNREIELQGHQAERVRAYFEGLSYEVAGP
jgi:translation initiation factor 1